MYRTITIEYQRSQAKDLVAYFKYQAEEEAIQRSQYVHLSPASPIVVAILCTLAIIMCV